MFTIMVESSGFIRKWNQEKMDQADKLLREMYDMSISIKDNYYFDIVSKNGYMRDYSDILLVLKTLTEAVEEGVISIIFEPHIGEYSGFKIRNGKLYAFLSKMVEVELN